MQETITETVVYLIGDLHGNNDALIRRIKAGDLRDCVLICVGDFGVGFQDQKHKEMARLKFLNEFFQTRNIQFYSIAGNHDDPDYFRGETRVVLSNLELLEDYTLKEFNGERFLFVGGAVSIDRIMRIPGRSWWEDEVFVLDPDRVQKCDVLITHSCPSWSGPFDKQGISGWCAKDPTLWEECVKERKDHDELIKLSEAKRHYCGHFHLSSLVDFGDCWSKILDIEEIVEHRKQ